MEQYLKYEQNTMTRFDIVKQVIDEWDTYGLLPTESPLDEFNRESKSVSNKISKESGVKGLNVSK
jgi:hypothetical protein